LEFGWILAPNESEEAFLKRKKVFDQVTLPKEKDLSVPLYDLCGIEACVIYSKDSLWPWQGAVLWDYETKEGDRYPVLQLRKNLFKMYKKEEVLAHELVHFVRFSFKEPFFEEMLAYQTSPQFFRRFMGPLFIYPLESVIFAFVSLLAPIVSIVFDSFLGVLLLLIIFGFFLVRLLVLHGIFSLCARKLKKAGVKSSFCLPVMLRLSDKEIVQTAFRSIKDTIDYFEKQAEIELRVSEILRSYFTFELKKLKITALEKR
jgi:hypothetical protein